MALALFDLDNTLLNGDSDHAWGMFLADIGAVDADEQQQKQDYFYRQYELGKLDMAEYLEFQLAPLTQFPVQQLRAWRQQFVAEIIQPMLERGKPHLLEPHRAADDKIVIITATNDFITRPIADLLDVETLIATRAEVKNDKYTGRGIGTPCYQQGKVICLNEWLDEQYAAGHAYSLADSYFYSDSANDLPLLEMVTTPIAVSPDDRLRKQAETQGWRIID